MKSFIRICICNLLITTLVPACPTCIGRLDLDTPPLFSQEYEKLYALADETPSDIVRSQEPVNEAQ